MTNPTKFHLQGNSLDVIEKHFKGFPTVASYKAQDKQVGDWTVKQFPLNGAMGYFSNHSDMGHGIALLKGDTTWMSITPLEIESHLIPNYMAKGTTVIAGLGLGMITMSILAKSKVKKLYVLEIDQELIDGFGDLLCDESQKLWHDSLASGRLEVIQADCTQPLSSEVLSKVRGADYMWVDIWENIFDETAIPRTRYLQQQIKAKTVDFWCMELEFLRKIPEVTNKGFSEQALYRAIELVNLPVSAITFRRKIKSVYAEICLRAGHMLSKSKAG